MKFTKNIVLGTILIMAMIGMSSCQKVLDKKDLTSIDGELIFKDSTLAFLNLSFIYDNNLPAWFGNTGGTINYNGTWTDEAQGSNILLQGTVVETSIGDFGTGLSTSNNWAKIRKINEFIRDVKAGSMPENVKNKMLGEALFLRAFRYFDLVRLYGGVPLVLEPMNPIGSNKENNFLPRNTTSECFTQMIADLDFAIENCPGRWPNADWGRITKGAAAAFKGRILLFYASPQFNPNNLQERWQAAYDANLVAKQLLDANGFGLNASYDQLWFSEVNNPEAVFVTGYNTKTGNDEKKNNTYDQQTRPVYLSSSGGGSNAPTWDMVQSYPMKDGKKINEVGAYTYDVKTFYKNRDPRFDKTIAYNGCAWPINGNASYRLWTYYTSKSNGDIDKTIEPNASNTGFYLRKAVNPNTQLNDLAFSGTDWIEIRYAEVLLNLAEAACGVNKNLESVELLKAIRKRAGIDAGSNNRYGLNTNLDTDRSALFEAVLYERKIELAFEGKRFWDLRRWKLFESALNGTRRKGVRIQLAYNTPTSVTSDINSQNLDNLYTNYFTVTEWVKDGFDINHKPEYYFFAIPSNAIQNNNKLKQNNTWGGDFNPLN